MTYSLNTLNNPRAGSPSPRSGFRRFAGEISLMGGFFLLTIWLIALLSYSPADPAWSSSGASSVIVNRAGRMGAWLADMSYFLLGFSVWWVFAAGVWSWLTSRLNGCRNRPDVPKRVFHLAVAITPEHIFERHSGRGPGGNRTIKPSVSIINLQVQSDPAWCGHCAAAIFREIIVHHQ